MNKRELLEEVNAETNTFAGGMFRKDIQDKRLINELVKDGLVDKVEALDGSRLVVFRINMKGLNALWEAA